MTTIVRTDIHNRLLRALDPEAFDMLQSGMERIELPLRTVLVESDQPTDHVFFSKADLRPSSQERSMTKLSR
jgi:hypothetical protein